MLHLNYWKKNLLIKDLRESIACKDKVLEEFTKIRHEYNNLLHTLTCLVELEDWQALSDYNSILLEKTQVLNKNGLAQLVRVKDLSILRTIYKLIIYAKDAGIQLNLTIFNDIAESNRHKVDIYDILLECLSHTGDSVDLKISNADQGLCFRFESVPDRKESHNLKQDTSISKNQRNKRILINTFFQSEHLIEEIILPNK